MLICIASSKQVRKTVQFCKLALKALVVTVTVLTLFNSTQTAQAASESNELKAIYVSPNTPPSDPVENEKSQQRLKLAEQLGIEIIPASELDLSDASGDVTVIYP